MALETVTLKHRDLQQISIHLPPSTLLLGDPVKIRQTVGEEIYSQWVKLDHTLVRLGESHAIRTKVIYDAVNGEEAGVCECIEGLLPETTKRGVVNLTKSIYIMGYASAARHRRRR